MSGDTTFEVDMMRDGAGLQVIDDEGDYLISSGLPLIWPPLGNSQSVLIRGVSSFQGWICTKDIYILWDILKYRGDLT